jgi:hypothetical protein
MRDFEQRLQRSQMKKPNTKVSEQEKEFNMKELEDALQFIDVNDD